MPNGQHIDLAAYQGRKVTFQIRLDEPDASGKTQAPMEGTVEAVNGPAMLFKPKGSALMKLIELDKVVEDTFEQIQEKPRELKAKPVVPLTLSNSRYHLLDRHGYELNVVNGMTDEAAYRQHELIDHSRLGHFHVPRDQSAEQPAAEQSEVDSSDEE